MYPVPLRATTVSCTDGNFLLNVWEKMFFFLKSEILVLGECAVSALLALCPL